MRKQFLGALAAMLILATAAGSALADGVTADADALSQSAPAGNELAANQQAGTTVEYDLSALITDVGSAANAVFKDVGDEVTVSITRSGDWLAASAGSPTSFVFTQYDVNQAGNIRITVPCSATNGEVEVMTAALAGTVETGVLNPDSVNLTYTITATTPASADCVVEEDDPDLTATKTNDTDDEIVIGGAFTWTITIDNDGEGDANFADEDVILADDLPSGANYTNPTTANASGVTGTIDCSIASGTLTCVADGPVVIGAGGSVDVTVDVETTAVGDLDNPAAGGECAVDPDNALEEEDETNNGCSDSVTVIYGICVLYDQAKSHKAGSTVPIKLALCDIDGNSISDASIVVQAETLKKNDNSAAPGVVEDSGQANPEDNFRFSEDLDGYIFNFSTKSPAPSLGGPVTKLTAGTWKLTFSVDGEEHDSYYVTFDVK